MVKFTLLLFFNLAVLFRIYGKECNDTINDGPYLFRTEQHINAAWIADGKLKQQKLTSKNFNEFKKRFSLKFTFRDLTSTFFEKPDFWQVFRNADSIAAISDIHGSYDGYIKLLKSQGIIDNNGNWNFGTGHLVVIGDVFDRGEKVSEILWHLFAMEKQAAKAGGKVHFLLGNHELMTFSEDLRYTNKKYIRVGEIAGMKYSELYSDSSVLGKWLRSKPVITTINDIIFVHGGISKQILESNISITEINRLFFQMLIQKAVESQNDIRNLVMLTEDDGPIWYRGFFDDPAFSEKRADSILSHYDKKHIVVGHTMHDQIITLFGNKIIGIDAGLGVDLPGGILIIRGKDFYKGYADGKREKL